MNRHVPRWSLRNLLQRRSIVSCYLYLLLRLTGTVAHWSLFMRVSEGIYTQPNTSLVCLQDHLSLRPFSMREVVDLEVLLDSDIQNRSIPPILMPEVVDLDDFPDSDLDTGPASFAEGEQVIDSYQIIEPLVCPELKLTGSYCDIPQIMPPRSVL